MPADRVHAPFGPNPLTPLHFLERSREVHADRTAYVDATRAMTYAELGARVDRLAGALHALGVTQGDRVSVLSPNTNLALEAHFGVPAAGAVLNAINTRLAPSEIAYILEHAGSKVLLVDHELADVARRATAPGGVRVVVAGGADDEYESLLRTADPRSTVVEDEWSMISLNYTSGTTGRPKGVMYAHRGAHLQSLAMYAQLGLSSATVFLWTLPMFHCNGWCFPWAVTAAGGVHVGLRRVEPAAIWAAVEGFGVTHFNAAPTVLTDLVHDRAAPSNGFRDPIRVATGGAPPSPALLDRLDALNVHVTHLYGLTETYGPAALCEWRASWDELPPAERARRRARQGVANVVSRNLRVVDGAFADVARDGTTIGEVVLRGDNVMLGYFNDEEATAAVDAGGWFRSGDLAVMHADGYIELRDRAKDVIISGGENIASIEVEQALSAHADVMECAVVGAPDERWGEVPVAFVTLRPGSSMTEAELITHVKGAIARFKAPKRVFFGPLPKTSTGKVQKFVLRGRAAGEPDPPSRHGRRT